MVMVAAFVIISFYFFRVSFINYAFLIFSIIPFQNNITVITKSTKVLKVPCQIRDSPARSFGFSLF